MNGYDASKAIRAMNRPDARKIPIIAMTADAFEEEKKKTLEAGMNYHLSKPINPKTLYNILSNHLTGKEA
jgi:CheY-like chemotaxis protein